MLSLTYERVYRNLEADAPRLKERPSVPAILPANEVEIRLENVLRWYDSIRQGSEPKQGSYLETLRRVLKREDKILLYDALRMAALVYKMTGNGYERNRHLEAADLLRGKFRLKLRKNKGNADNLAGRVL